jgi:uroporphyrinogen-III synthase
VITFTSASTVANLLAAIGGPDQLRAGARLASIGPVTTAALREHGLEPAIEAARHDIDGLIEALVADARDGSAARD